MTKDKDIKTVVPALRFPEFRNAEGWQVTQLHNVSKRITQKNTNGSINRVLTNSALEGIVDQRDYFDKDIANQNNLEGYYIVEKGDYVYNPRISNIAPVGPLSKNRIETGVMSPLYTVFRFDNSSNDFYAQYFQSTNWHKYLKEVSNKGARFDRMSITPNIFMDMPIPAPTIKEQEKIADCFGSLDDLISAVTDKVEALKEHKKGLMQQLFPANGKTTPALRFPEFQNAGEWKETTLVKLAKFRRGSFPQPYGLPEWFDENGMPFIQVYDVDDNMLLKPQTKSKISELAAKQSVFIPKETVIITIQGSIGRVAITQYDAYIDRTLLLFEAFYKPLNKVFFAYILQLLFDIEKQKAPGGIIKTITKEVLSDFKVNMPNIDEQQKIADCLSSIDKLISAETDKLDQLKGHKKGLMQQLFPTLNE